MKSTTKSGSIKGLEKIIKDTNAFLCIDCGECTGSCPLSRVKLDYSPRVTVEKLLLGYFDEIKHDDDIWSCLTCGLCSSRCPSDVKYNDFVRYARKAVREYTDNLNYSHNRVLQKFMEIMAQGNPQNRTDWIGKDLHVAEKGAYLLFTGCLPYFEVVFEYLSLHPVETAKNAVRILNGMGINPVVRNDEVCCGKDLLYNGDEENFVRLAKLNTQMIKESGAKKVVFICPEGLETVKKIYPEYVGKLDVDLLHITEIVDEALAKGKLQLGPSKYKKFTFQDPCSLGRGLGIYDAPRNIIQAIPEAELVPMEREKEDSLCCGPSAWISCTNYTKRIQRVRLEQAERSGAEVVVTACPKCTIHLSCALSSDDMEMKIKIKDITNIIAESMKGTHGNKK
jgi:heterodisulfide reductase subunit D